MASVIAVLIPVAINLSLAMLILSVGLQATLKEEAYLLRHPGLLFRSFLSMNVVMPVLAAGAAALLDLDPAIELAIIALSLSPIPPLLPSAQTRAGGRESYIVSLLAIMSALAIVVVPLGVEILGAIFGREGHVAIGTILRIVGIGIILPLAMGVIIGHLAPGAERFSRRVALVGTVLMVVAILPVLIHLWPLLISMVGTGTILVLVAFTLVGTVVGHFLGGPVEDNRAVLALATGTRHPGVAVAVATAADPTLHAVLAVVVWHLVVAAIASMPYAKWRARVHGGSSRAGSVSERRHD
jgi:BASS family bile acid:Na+ symporter